MTNDEIKSYCPNVSDSGSRMVPLPKLRELCLLALKSSSPIPEGMVRLADIPEGCTPTDARVLREANAILAEENHHLRRCLRWYANGEHIVGFDTWEGPSGDDNWLCPPSNDPEMTVGKRDYAAFLETLDEHMVEDGSIARSTLVTGKFEVESPEEEPKLIKGEPEWRIEETAKAVLAASGEKA